MIIENTGILDINHENVDEAKVELADTIIEGIYPLVDNLFIERTKEKEELERVLKLKEDELLKRKKELEGFMPKLIKKKKVKELLSWVAKLVQGGIIHEGKMRSQYVVLLKVADDFSDDKLDYHINNTKKLVTKRYQR